MRNVAPAPASITVAPPVAPTNHRVLTPGTHGFHNRESYAERAGHPTRQIAPGTPVSAGPSTKIRVFLTGATGNWGRAILREFRTRADRVTVIALALPTAHDRRILTEFKDMQNLEVVFGDLTDYAVVESCVSRADSVLHVGAVVSPLADAHPELAHRVNVGSMQNIVRAVAAQPDPGSIAVVGIGSVAETGDRPAPHHWGRVGDPIRVSQFDEYGQTKVIAERLLVDSGLPKWVWLRQTGILHAGLTQMQDPIMTHTPLAGVLEWVSAEDAARLLAEICEPGVPEEFWRNIYNVGGGEGWRITNWELQVRLLGALGVRDARRWYDRNWFALKNFHGQWFTDSDRLEALVPFRRDTFDEALTRAIASLPAAARLAGKVPAWIVKHCIIKPLTRRPRGTMRAVRSKNQAEIAASFGSIEQWQAIGDWSTFAASAPSPVPVMLDHGYDESVDASAWSIHDLQGAAAFRGGELRSDTFTEGDIATLLQWRCGLGHDFEASPRLVLAGGHWCPTCVKDPAGYPEQALHNAFLAQLEQPRAAATDRTGAVVTASSADQPGARPRSRGH